jgi:hypothetical protein
MAVSDWFVGARDWVTETPNIDGSNEDVTAPLGGLYLINPTPALDLLARLVVAMVAAGVPDAAAFVTEDRRVRLTSSATFTITWNAATTLRDLLGFSADLAGASGYTAPARSVLLWSPLKRATPELAQRGALGQEVADLEATVGPQGVVTARQDGAPTVKQRWSMPHVPRDRYRSDETTHTPGEFTDFWREQLLQARRFHLYLVVTEGLTDAPANYGAAQTQGPYKTDLTVRSMKLLQFVRSSGFTKCEGFYDVRVAALGTTEYSL